MIGLTISETTAQQLKKIAAVKGATTDELAERAIHQFLRDEMRRMMQRESEAYRAMHADLLAHYSGEYVAIYQGRLIDHDLNQVKLLKRIEEQYADAPILITPVLEQPEEVYDFRSPRVDHG